VTRLALGAPPLLSALAVPAAARKGKDKEKA
jgi:hypothetical protein